MTFVLSSQHVDASLFFGSKSQMRTINPLWRGPGWLLIVWSLVWSQQRPVNGLERRVPTVWTVLLARNTEGGRLNPFSRDLEGCESADMLCNPRAGLSRVSATRFSLDGCYSDLDTRTSDTRVARFLLNGEYCILYFFFLFKVQIWHKHTTFHSKIGFATTLEIDRYCLIMTDTIFLWLYLMQKPFFW